MAEAAVETAANPRSSHNYFCHQCSVSVAISPDLPDLVCPKCESGFIEEITQSDTRGEDSRSARSQLLLEASDVSNLLSNVLFNVRGPTEDPRDEFVDPPAGEEDEEDDDDEWIPQPRTRGYYPRFAHRRTQAYNRHVPSFIDYLLGSLTGGSGRNSETVLPFLQPLFHADPRDYAWGTDGLDNVITQLLNQMDGAGPPPAHNDEIESLPLVSITQQHIDKDVECSVCKEEFVLNEQVSYLPCQHVYHPDCITPWLKLHGTCPVCRQQVGTPAPPTREESNPAPPTTQADPDDSDDDSSDYRYSDRADQSDDSSVYDESSDWMAARDLRDLDDSPSQPSQSERCNQTVSQSEVAAVRHSANETLGTDVTCESVVANDTDYVNDDDPDS